MWFHETAADSSARCDNHLTTWWTAGIILLSSNSQTVTELHMYKLQPTDGKRGQHVCVCVCVCVWHQRHVIVIIVIIIIKLRQRHQGGPSQHYKLGLVKSSLLFMLDSKQADWQEEPVQRGRCVQAVWSCLELWWWCKDQTSGGWYAPSFCQRWHPVQHSHPEHWHHMMTTWRPSNNHTTLTMTWWWLLGAQATSQHSQWHDNYLAPKQQSHDTHNDIMTATWRPSNNVVLTMTWRWLLVA